MRVDVLVTAVPRKESELPVNRSSREEPDEQR
jgi:hypothetical protein